MNAFILGLDISSSAIGWCLLQGIVADHGVIWLDSRSVIGARCVEARDALERLLSRHAVDCIALESPVARFAKAVIPQARVSGALLELAERRGILTVEVTPSAAKFALAEDGAASKVQMLQAAAPFFGYDAGTLSYRCTRGEWAAWLDGCAVPEYREHEADALGVGLSVATKVMVEVAV